MLIEYLQGTNIQEDEDEDDEEDEEEADDQDEADDDEEEDDEDLDEAADPELRRKIEEALRVNGIQAATGESDDESEEELMDDDQMMAIDEQLTEVFKASASGKKKGTLTPLPTPIPLLTFD